MIPRIIHQTAKTKTLTWEERKLARRMQKILPGWEYRLWDDDDNLTLIHKYFPDFADAYNQIAFGVAKADIARYLYMYAFGGFYFDTDYRLLKPIGPQLLAQACVLPIEEFQLGHPQFKIGNAILGSQKNHPFWPALIKQIFEHIRLHGITHDKIVLISGPLAVTQCFLDNQKLFNIALPERDEFHPDRRFFGLSHRGNSRTTGIHLCWGSWRGKKSLVKIKNFLRRKITAL
jgi:mannosyltransferase OCH1-like enzyme